MNNRITYFYLTRAWLIVMAVTFSVPAAYAYSLEPQQSGDITFVTGGIGDEERSALQAAKNDYNLSIISAASSGAYVGDTRLVISDLSGRELLDTDAGPLFYAQLPPGRYVVEGESQGQIRRQNITIAENRNAHIHFSWK